MKLIAILIALAVAFMVVPPSLKWNFAIGGGRVCVPIGFCIWASLLVSALGALLSYGR